MNYKWAEDDRFLDDLDLLVQASEDDWHIIAFIRWDIRAKRYRCRFLGMADDEFPDGKTFKTARAAKNFCEHHLPVMWIRHNAQEST